MKPMSTPSWGKFIWVRITKNRVILQLQPEGETKIRGSWNGKEKLLAEEIRKHPIMGIKK